MSARLVFCGDCDSGRVPTSEPCYIGWYYCDCVLGLRVPSGLELDFSRPAPEQDPTPRAVQRGNETDVAQPSPLASRGAP